MPSIKTISRSSNLYEKRHSNDNAILPRNYDPAAHPFQRAREYTRALRAVKIERMMAKPFLCQMGNGHEDGVYALARHPDNINMFASASADGTVKLWDKSMNSSERQVMSVKGHKGIIKDLAITPNGQRILSCGADRQIKVYGCSERTVLHTIYASEGLNSLTHHRTDNKFATASSVVNIWDINYPKPIQTLDLIGQDTVSQIRFNQTEQSILAATGNDRSISIYDTRTSQPLQKLIMSMRTNAIAWNPMEAFNFATASEDHNIYIFDMRNLKNSLNVLKDHVNAVMCIDYSPTGEEIVSGSYDRSIRLWRHREGRSRDIYHTKRMQRIFSVVYGLNNSYILSGSDDGNVRMWRAEASERAERPMQASERNQRKYLDALKEKYKNMPEIKRISKKRQTPKIIKRQGEIVREELAAVKRKEDNKRKHSAKGSVPYAKERTKMLVSVQK